MPEEENILPENNASYWEAIERWIPEEHLKEYQRFVYNVKDLPGSDPILHAILAMGVFTVIARQVPGEVAKQLDAVKEHNGHSLAIAQQYNDQVLRTMQESAAHVADLLRVNVTREQLNIKTEQALTDLVQRLKSYLEPNPNGHAAVLRVEAGAAATAMANITRRCNDGIKVFDSLLGKIDNAFKMIDLISKQLEARITKDVTTKLKHDFERRKWMWMVIGALFAVFTFSMWKLGAMHQAALDRSKPQPSEEQADK